MKLKYRLDFEGALGVDCEGRGGGLALFWKGEMELEILNYFKHHIHAQINNSPTQKWTLPGVYGHPEVARNPVVWNLIKILYREDMGPWLLRGDFNEILSNDEKRGRRLKLEQKNESL